MLIHYKIFLTPVALLAELDFVLITDVNGELILGLEWDGATYITTQTANITLSNLSLILGGQEANADEIIRTNQGLIAVSIAPIYTPDRQIMGVMLVGTALDNVMSTLTVDDADLSFFDGNTRFLMGTNVAGDFRSLETGDIDGILASTGIVMETARFTDGLYQVAYFPLIIRENPIAIATVYQPSTTRFATSAARQMFSLIAATLAAVIVITTYVFIARFIQRIEHIKNTAYSLTLGNSDVRTKFAATDEIGELAVALDTYADAVSIQYRSFDQSITTSST